VAVLTDFRLWYPVAVLKTVQNNFDSPGMQSPQLMINHNDAAVIVWIWNVEGNDMKKHGAKIRGFGRMCRCIEREEARDHNTRYPIKITSRDDCGFCIK
jgi:hypothetical protein